MYIDESGIDNTEHTDIAERENALKSGKKTQRVSMIAALSNGKIVAPMTFEGYCDTEVLMVGSSNFWHQFYSLDKR